MNADIRRLYLFHLFNSVAVTVVASQLFMDKLFLRLDLNMSQLGIIKGVSIWLPMGLNLLISPYVTRLNADRKLVSVLYLFRVVLPLGLLGLPFLTEDKTLLTSGFATILIITQIFPSIANNSLMALCRSHIPQEELGRRMSTISVLWNTPYFVAAIPCGWYLDRYELASNSEFLRAFLNVSLITIAWQVPASWVIWRLTKIEPGSTGPPPSIRNIAEPFQHMSFRKLLTFLLAASVLLAMCGTFVIPYMINGLSMSLSHISIIEATVFVAGIVLVPMWGRIVDRFGGRNSIRISLFGIAAGLFALSIGSPGMALVFAALAWKGHAGLFGFGMLIAQQVLTLSLSPQKQSNIYLAAAAFVGGCGTLIGSVGGGLLLDWLKTMTSPDQPDAHFKIFFTYCALGILLLGELTATLRDGKRRISRVAMAVELSRMVRSMITRQRY